MGGNFKIYMKLLTYIRTKLAFIFCVQSVDIKCITQIKGREF
jgi:hypothetical protein